MGSRKVNSGEHIDYIINLISCEKHEAPKGYACYEIHYNSKRGETSSAVCGTRIIEAGFNGEINPSSLSRMTHREAKRRP